MKFVQNAPERASDKKLPSERREARKINKLRAAKGNLYLLSNLNDFRMALRVRASRLSPPSCAPNGG